MSVAKRIATLQRHLAGASLHDESHELEAHQTSAELRAAPGGGPGTLSITDSRTGRRYDITIGDHGTIKATDLKQITAGGDGVGLRTYDNGWVRQ